MLCSLEGEGEGSENEGEGGEGDEGEGEEEYEEEGGEGYEGEGGEGDGGEGGEGYDAEGGEGGEGGEGYEGEGGEEDGGESGEGEEYEGESGEGYEGEGSGDDVTSTPQPTVAPTTTPTPVVTMAPSVMTHVTVIKPTEGIVIIGRPPILNHVTVLNSSSDGIKFDDFLHGEFTLNECSVLASKGRGSYFRSSAVLSNASLQLNACTLENNGDAGIYVESNVNISIVGSSIRKNSKSGCMLYGRGTDSRYIPGCILFSGNTVSENRMHGLKSHCAAKMSISSNDFSRNLLGVNSAYATLHLDQSYVGVDVSMRNNSFTDNINYYKYSVYYSRYRLSYTIYFGFRYNAATIQVSLNVKTWVVGAFKNKLL